MKKFLLGLIGFAFVAFSVIKVTTDHKFTVVHFAEVKQDGYGIVAPETFKVEMSPSIAFHYAHQHKTFGFIIACVLLVASVAWVWIAQGERINFGKAGEGIYNNAKWVWFSLVIVSIVIFFADHGSIMGNNYIGFDRTNYVNIRGNDLTTPFKSSTVDSLFLNKVNIIK